MDVKSLSIAMRRGGIMNRGFTLIELMIVIAIIAIIAAIAIPNLIEARKSGNESSAIGTLRTISTAQTLFREADRDGNETLDYASSLANLSNYELIDSVLGAGTKQGYVFSITRSSSTPEFQWNCTAAPQAPGSSGTRYFYVNETGVIRFETNTAATSTSPALGR
jgi:prepilin-type N-terminal cleavage/methylation domain-containing protein